MRTGNSDAERADFGICGKADDVESKSHCAVHEKCRCFVGVHLVGTIGANAIKLAGEVGVYDALDEGEGRHAEKEVEGVELEGLRWEDAGEDGTTGRLWDGGMACLEKVGENCFEGGEDCADEGKDEAPEGEVVVAVGCKAYTDHDWYQGEELGGREGAGEEDIGDCNDKEGGSGADDLVERDGDKLKRYVGDCDVDGIKEGKGGEEEGFPSCQSGWSLEGRLAVKERV